MADEDQPRGIGRHKHGCGCAFCENARKVRGSRKPAPVPAPAPAGEPAGKPPIYRARRAPAKAKKKAAAKPPAEPAGPGGPERSSGGGFLGGLLDGFRG